MIGKKHCEVAGNVIDLSSPETPLTPLTPLTLSPIFCVKNVEKMKELEKREDCFILDFDPECPPIISKLSDKFDDTFDISVIAERGQVACRDYPHSRHVCLKNSFDKTPHENYCELCYCFVCDSAAPCKMWTGVSGHCHAIDNETWRRLRNINIGSMNRC